MTAILDIVENTSISHDKDGYRVQRIAVVESVTGTASARIYNAINDAQLPAIGDVHPDISSIKLQNKTGQIIDADTVRVVLEYYDDPENEVGIANASIGVYSSVSAEETDYDINGEPLYTHYSSGGNFVSYDPMTAEVERPRKTIRFDWIDTAYPRALVDNFEGAINSTSWNGYAPETVLCAGFDVREQGTNYRISAEFVYEPETWKFIGRPGQIVEFPLGDYPVPTPDTELDKTTGERPFDVYRQIDFNSMGLTIGGSYVTLTGSMITAQESEIVSGGRTIVLTLTGDTWVTAGATFDAQRQNILDGLVSNKNEAAGFNAMSYPVTNVVRSSDTVVTITLGAQAGYAITQSEVITATIPASALTSSALPFLASQKMKIQAA